MEQESNDKIYARPSPSHLRGWPLPVDRYYDDDASLLQVIIIFIIIPSSASQVCATCYVTALLVFITQRYFYSRRCRFIFTIILYQCGIYFVRSRIVLLGSNIIYVGICLKNNNKCIFPFSSGLKYRVTSLNRYIMSNGSHRQHNIVTWHCNRTSFSDYIQYIFVFKKFPQLQLPTHFNVSEGIIC